MSQMASQILDPSWGSFPLAKFSHHTGPYGSKAHTWTHVNYRNDLDFVLKEVRLVDEYGCHESRNWLKVNGGFEVLESQDITQLVQYCKEFNSKAGGEHPVELVVKCPFLAMKYPKTAQTVRRFQVKFRHEVDFTRVVNILKGLGLPLVDRGSSASIPATVSPTPSIVSMASSGRISLPGPTSETHVGMQTPAGSSTTAFLSPVKSDFKIPWRPEPTSSEDRRVTPASPFSIPYSTGQVTNMSTTPSLFPPPQRSRLASYNKTPNQSSIYVEQIEHENRRLSHPTFQTSNFRNTNNVANNSPFESQIRASHEDHPDIVGNSSRILTYSPFFSLQAEKGPAESSTTDTLQELLSQRSVLEQRPASTPAKSGDIQNLWIPPRRELPFLKSQDATRRKSSPARDFSPLPKPTPVSKDESAGQPTSTDNVSSILSTAKPAPKKRVAQRKPTIKRVENFEPSVANAETSIKDTGVQDNTLSPLAAKSNEITPQPTSATAGLVSKATAPTKKRAAPARPASVNKRAKMVDQGTQTGHIKAPPQLAQANNYQILDLVTDMLSTNSPPEEYLDHLDTFITKHKARPAPKELWETPGYADADEAQRQMMLNEFICENLDNKDFIQLCQDTEFAWRRMGLGM